MSKIVNMTGAAYMSGEHLLKYIGSDRGHVIELSHSHFL